MSDLNALRSLAEVVRCGSVTKAASLLGISQPTVSAHLRQLEERFGRKLVRKAGRGILPTGFARELAARIDPAAEALAEILQTYGAAEHQAVVIAAPRETLGVALLQDVLAQPDLAVRVEYCPRERMDLDRLEEAEIDLAVFDHRPSPTRFQSRELMLEPLHLVAASGFHDILSQPLRDILAVSPLLAESEDMGRLVQLARAQGMERREIMALAARPKAIIPDEAVLARMVAAGFGVAALPRCVIAEGLASRQLITASSISPVADVLRIAWSARYRLRESARRARDIMLQTAQRLSSSR
jgi:DNA-binding transcriptional LysR family regulator